MALPQPITELVAELSKLPGIGPRSAERLALHLVQKDAAAVNDLARCIVNARGKVRFCRVCGALTERDPCAICEDPRRDGSVVCVVERPVDILAIEKSGTFHGRYHVLGGKISPVNGIDAESLRIAALESRLDSEPIKELILALSTDVDGDATAYYLAKQFGSRTRVSRIASGLPAGSGLEFADEVTLNNAIRGRTDLK